MNSVLRTVCCLAFGAGCCLALGAGCTPRIAVEAPKEPIVINMNIKIEHEIRVKVDEDLDKLLADEKDLF